VNWGGADYFKKSCCSHPCAFAQCGTCSRSDFQSTSTALLNTPPSLIEKHPCALKNTLAGMVYSPDFIAEGQLVASESVPLSSS
jgi:hypothetical protein